MNRSAWTGTTKKHKKHWGHEIVWTGLFRGKEIFIKSGHRTSLKFNVQKNELLYVQSGEIFAEYADEAHLADSIRCPSKATKLMPGDILNVQAGCPYRLSALSDSIVFEISDNQDRASTPSKVIIEDDYGRDTKEAKRKNIIFKALVKK